MRLTKQTNYAIRILMYCAANEGQLSRVSEIAKAYSVSDLFLFKILKPLVDSNIVESVRGRNGGIRLAKPSHEITLLNVVQLTEDNFAMADCFDNDTSDCPLVDSCALNSALREALNAFFAVLHKHTIASLHDEKPNINKLLGLDDLIKSSAKETNAIS